MLPNVHHLISIFLNSGDYRVILMSRIFISYSSTERPEAIRLQKWLEENGWQDDVFVDVDPEHGLTGGEGWRNALRDAAGRCEAVILLLSRAWLSSKPCWNEFLLAEKYGKPCIPVRIDEGITISALPPEITNHYQVIEKVAAPPIEFETRLKRALETAGAGPENFPLAIGRRPYPGLQALTEQDAALLFGRDADVLSVIDSLREIRTTSRRRLFVLLGASGAGKSSLMRAGIWPRINRDDRNFIALPIIRPSNAILSGKEGLWQALETACADERRVQHIPATTPRTRAAIRIAAETSQDALFSLLTTIKEAASTALVSQTAYLPSPVLFIDQGEELLNPEGALEADIFFRLLQPIWERDPQLILFVAIRSDVYPQLQTDPRIPQQQLHPFNLSPISSAGLLQVIEGPAKRVGLKLEPALTAALLRDSEGADALPLLAFTLERLYEERLDNKSLTLSDYVRLGGVKGAIEAAVRKVRYDAETQGVSPSDLDALLRRTFIPYLARVNDAGQFSRRLSDLSEIPSDCHTLVNILVTQRLLLIDQRGENKTIEIAHEAILREWSLLAGWLDAERSFLEWREQIGRSRKQYEQGESDLLSGRSLIIAQSFMETRTESISETDRLFIQKSTDAENNRIAEEEAEKETLRQAELTAIKSREEAAIANAIAEKKLADAARKASKKMRKIAVLMGILTLVTGGAGYIAYSNGQKAEAAAQKEKIASEQANWSSMQNESRGLAIIGEDLRNKSDGDKATALAWLALPHDSNMNDRPIMDEASSLIYRRIAKFKKAFDDTVIFSKDGSRFLNILMSRNEAILINSHSLKEIQKFPDVTPCNYDYLKKADEYPYVGTKPAYFIDADKIMLCHSDKTVKTWNIGEKSAASIFSLDKLNIRKISLNENKPQGIAISDDGKASIWNIEKSTKTSNIDAPPNAFDNFSWAFFTKEHNRVIAYYGEKYNDEHTILWDSNNGRKISVINYDGGHIDASDIKVSPNQKSVLLPFFNRDTAFISLIDGKRTQELNLSGGEVSMGSYFSDDGQFIIGHVGMDQSDLIDVNTGKSVLTLCTDADSAAYLSNDMMLAACESFVSQGDITIWKKTEENEFKLLRKIPIPKSHYGDHEYYPLDSIGNIVVQSLHGDARLRLIDVKNGISVQTLINELSISNDNNFTGNTNIEINGSILAINNYEWSEENYKSKTYLWDIHQENPIISSIKSPVKKAVLLNKKLLLGLTNNGGAKIWDISNKSIISELNDHKDAVTSASYNRDKNIIITGDWSGMAIIWEPLTGKSKKVLSGHSSGMVDVDFSKDGKFALTASHDGTAKIWDVESGVLQSTLKGHNGSVMSASFSPDGSKVLTASTDETAVLWDVDTGKQLVTMKGHTGSIFKAYFNHDGSQIITASEDHTARIWDANTGENITILQKHTSHVHDALWTPNGKLILTISEDKTGILWDAETFEPIHILKGHLGAIRSSDFSSDNKQLATVSDDQTLRLWDIETGAMLATYSGHEKMIHSVAFGLDNTVAATTSEDGTIKIWNIFPGSLKERIAEVSETMAKLQPLTKDECEQYGVNHIKGAEVVCQTADSIPKQTQSNEQAITE